MGGGGRGREREGEPRGGQGTLKWRGSTDHILLSISPPL